MFGADHIDDNSNKPAADRALVEHWFRRALFSAPTPQQVDMSLRNAGVEMTDELRTAAFNIVAEGYGQRIRSVEPTDPQAVMDVRNELHDTLTCLRTVGVSREAVIALRAQLNPPGEPTANEVNYAL
jgi:hypothetical protein